MFAPSASAFISANRAFSYFREKETEVSGRESHDPNLWFFTSWNMGHECSSSPNVYPSPAPWIPTPSPAVPEPSLIAPIPQSPERALETLSEDNAWDWIAAFH